MKQEDVPHVRFTLTLANGGRFVAKVRGRTTKFVCCEACGQNYAYELKRTGVASEPARLFDHVGPETAAKLGAYADLRNRLRTGIEVIPCPACGWYQAHMLPKARRLHPRWMVYVGGCLTFGLIPVTLIGLAINGMNEDKGKPSIPWPIFFAGMASLFIVGIGMLIGKYILARSYDPNDDDVETRKRYGQSRALLLSEQEVKDMEARLLSEQEAKDMEARLLWRANASDPIDWSVRPGCPTLPRSDVSGAGPQLSSWLPGLALRSAALLLLLLLLLLLPGPD
jgi:hypothetical protein